jgi:hypothetical protein
MVVWSVLAGLAGFWSLVGLGAGEGAFLPGLLGIIALGCAVNTGIRDRVMDKVLWAFSGSGLRAVVILTGAMMLWQLVGVELALLMAGDVLAYVEVLAAVSLIAANTRLGPLKARLVERLDPLRRKIVIPFARASRAIRAIRPPRPGSPPADDGDPAGPFAFA